MSVLGIDPGKNGAIACMTEAGAVLWIEDMPDCTGSALGAAIGDLIKGEGVSVAIVEFVAARPGQAAPGMWKFGANYGAILGALGALGVRVVHVTPRKWKAGMTVTADKASSRQRARELWPTNAEAFKRVKDDGRAEAALIAEWWRTKGQP